MANIWPPQYNTPLGQLRALLFQTERYKDPANPEAPADYLVSDDQLSAYIAINGDKLYGAAADALLALASNEALVSKKIRTEDLSTDGPAVAAELRRTAAEFKIKQNDLDESSDSLEAFEIVDFYETPAKWPLR